MVRPKVAYKVNRYASRVLGEFDAEVAGCDGVCRFRWMQFEPETSSAMGFGFRCGFLGLLHMEIVQERLEREYNLSLITTAPSVVYRVICRDDSVVECSNPADLPDAERRKAIEEPFVKVGVFGVLGSWGFWGSGAVRLWDSGVWYLEGVGLL